LLNIFGGDMNIFKQMSRCIAIMAGACFGASQYAAMHVLFRPDSRTSVTLTNNQCHNLTVLLNIFGGDMNIFKQMSRCIAIMAGACFGASQYARASGRTKICTFQRRHQIRLNTRPKPRWRWRCVHSLW
jgi:hypothetical protein